MGSLGAHIERRCSRARGADVTISDITIKTPDRKWDWGREWRHARKRWGFRGFEKKAVSWDLNSEQAIRFLARAEGSTKCAARAGVRWKSQHRKKLCLSLLMSKNLKLKKVIKSFVPEPISTVFGFLYMFMNILWSYVYFTYPYHGYVTQPDCLNIDIIRIRKKSGYFSFLFFSFFFFCLFYLMILKILFIYLLFTGLMSCYECNMKDCMLIPMTKRKNRNASYIKSCLFPD